MIAKYCSVKFKDGDSMLQYGLNVLLEYGTAIFIFDLKSNKEGENKLVYELKPMKTDITLNPKFYD